MDINKNNNNIARRTRSQTSAPSISESLLDNKTKSSYHQILTEGDEQQNKINNSNQGVATEEFSSQEANYFNTQESLPGDENLTNNQKTSENQKKINEKTENTKKKNINQTSIETSNESSLSDHSFDSNEIYSSNTPVTNTTTNHQSSGQPVQTILHNAGLTSSTRIQSSNITSNNQINTTAPIQENRNSTLPPISENLPQNITTSVNSQNWAATSTITQQPQAATSPSSTTGTPAPTDQNAGIQHQDSQRLHLSHSQHLPAKPMTYAESAASAQLAVKMVTTKLGGNSKSKSKSAKSITVPSYFLDRLNNGTVSREYPTVTSFNGRALDKKRFLDEIVNFRDLLLQHPEFQGKVTNYCCNFVDATNEHSSGMIEQYLNSFCIPTTDILFDDPQEAKRLHDGHLQLLQEYFQRHSEFKIQLPTSKRTQLAIIQLEYDHETAAYQDHLYNLVLKTYGELIYQQLPDFNPFTEANNTVAAYYLIDFASDVIPASTVFPLPNYRKCAIPHYGKVSVNIISHLKFCTYCKTRGHSIKHCPLRPLKPNVYCKHCHTNTANHNYLSCAAIPVDAKLAALEKLPNATIQRALRTVYALKQIPQSLLLNERFPVSKLTKEQYQKFVVQPSNVQQQSHNQKTNSNSNGDKTNQHSVATSTPKERPSNVNPGEQWHTVASSSRRSATINPVTNLSDPHQVNQFVVLSQPDNNGAEMISEPTQHNLQTQVLDSQDSNMDTDADYDPMQNSSEDEYSDSTENIQSDDNQL